MTAATATDIKMRCIEVIERFPKGHLPNLLASLEAMHKMIDDALDEAYCLELYRSSLDEDNDEAEDFFEFAKRLGVEINEANDFKTPQKDHGKNDTETAAAHI